MTGFSNFRKWYLLATCLMIALGAFPAVAPAADGDAGQAGEFLRYGVSIRSLGMGRAYVALADDAGGLYYNAAGLLRAPRRFDAYLMYSKPLGLSTYDFVAFALPRPRTTTEGAARWLYGPETAWGIAGINLSSGDFEHRDDGNVLIGDGDFGIYQQALMVGYAREFTGPSGVLGLGATFKMIRQGIKNADEYDQSDFGVGLDLGAQVQLLSPPLIKDLASLKFLIPLRLGVNIQNLVPPSVGFGGVNDDYPTSIRWGWSYKIRLDSSRVDINLANDFEKVTGTERGLGVFGGVEMNWYFRNAVLSPRAGLMKVGDDDLKPAIGTGVTLRRESFDLRLDVAWGHNDHLSDDFRFALTAQFGKRHNSRFFDQDCDPALSSRDRHLHVVSNYPEDMPLLETAATTLATVEDIPNKRRYYDLIKGYGLALELASEARTLFQRASNDDDSTAALVKATSAVTEYARARVKNQHSESEMPANHLVAYGESWLIIGAVAGRTDTLESLANAVRLLRLAPGQARPRFLLGTALFMQGEFDEASEQFAAVSGMGKDAPTLEGLSRLKLAECQVKGSAGGSALEETLANLKDVTSAYHRELKKDYPRYQLYPDRELADDAQFWLARVLMKLNRNDEALLALGKICRFYSRMDACGYPETAELMRRLADELH